MSLSQDAVLNTATSATGADVVSATAEVSAGRLKRPANRWDEGHAAALDEAGQLLYRSNLLGADLSVTNFGGGNTSAKLIDIDPLTRQPVEVLWVKGSGGDLGSMGRDGFATLYLDRVRGLETLYRGRAFEDEMVGFLPHCTFALNPRPASIDTPLHAFIPYAHVDHLHPDAVVAIAATHESEALTREIFGGEVGWIAWQRPGFDLGLRIGEAVRAHPNWKGLVLEGHGLFSWGATARECYDTSVELIGRAVDAINARLTPAEPGRLPEPAALRAIIERLRPLVSSVRPKLCELLADDDMRALVASPDILADAGQGAACPDHFLRTKPWPLVLEPELLLGEGSDAYVRDAVAAYRQRYRGYYERCRHDDSPALRDPDPVVVLVRDTCALAFAADRTGARIAGEYARNALTVIAGARTLGTYKALDEQEMFDIEYWLLEEAKLKRQPASKRFAGQVAVITGGAGGIGRAVAAQILAEDGCVMLTDIDAVRLEAARADLSKRFSADRVRAFAADVADEASVEASVEACVLGFGGVDILVANAGIASAAPVSETSLDLWQSNFRVLSEGYFLPAREAFKVMKAMGGSIVFVASKNALVASANTSAYSSAKAAELQLARCLALEGAPYGVRVNVVNPDAVLKGSAIWTGEWRAQRAAAYNLREDELDDFYRQRSLLKRSVLPEDVAEAVVFLAGPAAAKSTGNILNVDAGNAAAFTR
jgi:rhamnulose-1-phosphate aldolase/alcohol dehydrogenase